MNGKERAEAGLANASQAGMQHVSVSPANISRASASMANASQASASQADARQPKLGLQGPVIAWQDSWAGEESDRIMRTGTGSLYPSQDPLPPPEAFVAAMQELGAGFYVHHLFPSLAGQSELLCDMAEQGMEIVLGNEYGNINGPYVEGTNRYDVPDDVIVQAARSGALAGLLYDEPEHLQINAGQYRKDDYLPHWGRTDRLRLEQAEARVVDAIADRVQHVRRLLGDAGIPPERVPLISEQVFPVLFHAHARGGMAVCPKVMKESFQPLQLATALGAARQYGTELWICADLWGPDAGQWFTRTSGFPGHSPEEYASALRMAYAMGPARLFTENIDALLRYGGDRFRKTEFGEIWQSFATEYVPRHPLTWSHLDASPDIVLIHSDDSNYGQNARLYGNREPNGEERSASIFHAWHLLSHGTIPSHGSCMHIPGFDFPRHRLKAETTREQFPLERGRTWEGQRRVHPLFYPANNVLVYDDRASEPLLRGAKLIVAAGSRLSPETARAMRRLAEEGAAVVAGEWLLPAEWRERRAVGAGQWVATDDFLSDDLARETIAAFAGSPDCWVQRFGEREVRMYRGDDGGFTLDFEFR